MRKWMSFGLVFFIIFSFLSINSPVSAAGFNDVPARAAKEVNYLSQGQIVNGFTPTVFKPDQTITRAEAAAFLGRTLQLNGNQRATRFSDVGSSNFASGYIEALAEKGVFQGTPDKKFYPAGIVTRGEMAVLLARAFGYSSNAEQALVNLGIASGLANGTFGSSQKIKRADFAVFLSRAINPDFRLKKTSAFSASLVSTASNLNIRSGPSTAYASLGKISANTAVKGAHSIGGWTYVKVNSKTGFISSSYLKKATAAATPAPSVPTESSDSRLSSQTIILDPGHGGKDPGAVANGLKEKDVALKMSLLVRNLLKQTPVNVKMTRSDDTFLELKDRAAFAGKQGGDIFLSVHANAASPQANGTETFYYAAGNPHAADSKLLAEKIQARMIKAWDLRDRGVKNGNFAVLRGNSIPAALLEMGFVTNQQDAKKMSSDADMKKMSVAIYNGILDYYDAKGYNVKSLYK